MNYQIRENREVRRAGFIGEADVHQIAVQRLQFEEGEIVGPLSTDYEREVFEVL